VVGRGKVLADATIEELVSGVAGDHVLLRTQAPAQAAEALRQAGAVPTVIDSGRLSVAGMEAQQVVEALSEAGVAFSEVTTQRATLEDVYFQLTGSAVEFRSAAHGQEAP
jgi:ABC-2 type transport system ATP-binding protein